MAKKSFNRIEDVELPDSDIIEQYKVDITPVGSQGIMIRLENRNV